MPADKRWAFDDVLEASREPDHPELEVRHGMTLTHTASAITGTVAGFSQGDRVVLVDRFGTKQVFRAHDGAFKHDGVRVALRAPAITEKANTVLTASGSVDAGAERAQVASPSRIWVEGVHDAELIGKIWGHDLRISGVVAEPLHGADDLAAAVDDFRPTDDRRLGILLDHLVEGSKESRIAAEVDDPNVLIRGHPYVDIWAAITPQAAGIDAWPEVPRGRPWKEGVMSALGVEGEPGPFWGSILNRVTSWHDAETPLVNAVEQLLDFVTVAP